MCLPAEAGHYEVTYSGGTVTTTGTNPVCGRTLPYATDPQTGWYGGSGTAGVCMDPPPVPGTGTVVCQGVVTMTFTWIKDPPDDLEEPPGSVIVKKTSTANWAGDGGTAANGLGHPALPPSGFTQTSTGVQWIAVNEPGPLFTLTIDPSASCTFELGGASGMNSGSAGVTVKAETFPVRIQFTGTTEMNGPSILIGQRLVSTVVGIPGEVLDDDPSIEPNDSYTWEEPPGRPFLDYRPDLMPTTFQAWADPGAPSMAAYFSSALDPDDAYAEVQESEPDTIRCVVLLPRYGLTLRPKGTVNVHRPIYVYSTGNGGGEPRIGSMHLLRRLPNNLYVVDETNPEWFKLWGQPPPIPHLPGYKVGAAVRLSVIEPTGFGPEVGQWNYSQKGWLKYHVKDASGNSFHNESWGLEGLDGSFPYPQDGGPWAAGASYRMWVDSPGVVVAPSQYEWWDIRDRFWLYVFYKPPGTDSRWVPILVHPWLCGGLAVKGTSSWTASNQDNAFLAKGHYPWPLPMWERLLDGSVLVEGDPPP